MENNVDKIVKKIVIRHWNGCGLHIGTVEGDMAVLYEDILYQDEEGNWRDEAENSIYDDFGILELLKTKLFALIEELKNQGYEISEDLEIIDEKFEKFDNISIGAI